MYLEVLCRVSLFKLQLFFFFFFPVPCFSSSRPVCVLLRGAVMTLKHEHLKGFWWEPHCLLWRLPKRGFYFVVGFNASVCYLITLRQSREAGIFPDWQSFKNIDHQQDCSWCRPCIFMRSERPDYSYYRIISGEAQFISPDFSLSSVSECEASLADHVAVFFTRELSVLYNFWVSESFLCLSNVVKVIKREAFHIKKKAEEGGE